MTDTPETDTLWMRLGGMLAHEHFWSILGVGLVAGALGAIVAIDAARPSPLRCAQAHDAANGTIRETSSRDHVGTRETEVCVGWVRVALPDVYRGETVADDLHDDGQGRRRTSTVALRDHAGNVMRVTVVFEQAQPGAAKGTNGEATEPHGGGI